MNYVEHQHQCALISWAYRTKIPPAADIKPGATIGDYLLAIPNGGKRGKMEAIRLKAEGVKPGVSDLLLPLRRKGCAGLWLEMKAPGNRPTPDQERWLDRMELAGYLATYRDDWIEAAAVICRYLGIPEPLSRIRQTLEDRQCSGSSKTSPKSSGLATPSSSLPSGGTGTSASRLMSKKATRSR